MNSWTFHSFSMERFLHYFGQSTAAEANRMVEAGHVGGTDKSASVDMEQIGQ